jgi:hypothetical protein
MKIRPAVLSLVFLATDGHIEANWGIVADFHCKSADRMEEE